MKRLITLTVFFIATYGYSQKDIRSNLPILLKNVKVLPLEQNLSQTTEFNNKHYVIVQHPSLTLSNDFYGFNTFEYLPKHSAFASINSDEFELAKTNLESVGGSVIEINPDWKLSRKMYNHDYPSWAWLGDDKMKVWLSFWPNLDLNQLQEQITKSGFEVIEVNSHEKRIALALNPENTNLLKQLPFIKWIQEMEDPGHPENFTAQTNHRVNALQQGIAGGIHYDGSGITVGHNDDAELGNHIDYKGRLVQAPGVGGNGDHGDHTAGTIFGAGNMNPLGEGMAPGADMYYAEYPDNLNDADIIYVTENARLTSNSFSNGCNAGYTGWSQQVDQDAYDNPLMLHVFSAGNDGASNCSYGAGAGWGNVTGGHKQGKNAVTVANLSLIDALNSSSSRGPAADGRIKPDISAVGTNVFSTTDEPEDNSYVSYTGTSMSCPGVSGSLAVLMQAFKDHNGGTEAHGALLKAIILNSADDLGNPGPDFQFGYGRINVNRAYDIIENAQYLTDTASTGDSLNFQINVPSNVDKLKVMVLWADPSGSTSSAIALVNDLDMTLEDGSNVYQPWVLDPTPNATALNSNAVRARDSLNNMEQVTIDQPSAGTKNVIIKGFNVPSGPQQFFIVYSYEMAEIEITYPLPGDPVRAITNEYVRIDAPASFGSLTAEYSTDHGQTWLNINTTSSNYVVWGTPLIAHDSVYLRVYNAMDTAISGPLMVAAQTTLNVDAICPDTVYLSWGGVNDATGYTIYQLGTMYMDSVAFSDTNYIALPHNSSQEDYYAVSAMVNNSKGFRSIAEYKAPGISNCVLNKDLEITQIISPSLSPSPDCFGASVSDVTVVVTNVGLDTLSNYDLGFEIAGSGPVVESVINTLAPGVSHTYTFNATVNITAGSTPIDLWVSSSVTDQNTFNDTISGNIGNYASSLIATFPYNEDFETFNTCGTSSDCEATNCQLTNGWVNGVNQSEDAIDFRVHYGTTPSGRRNPTGPSVDAVPGTNTGLYLYLEASGGCDSAEAFLVTPCFDLSGMYIPRAKMMYHMYGDDMGTLTVDIYDGEMWYNNFDSILIAGDQGDQWNELDINLQQFVNDTIIIRYRGKTGSGFNSDLALDGFSLEETSGASLNENAVANFKVYPNPSNRIFNLEHSLDGNEEIQISIVDSKGALVFKQSFNPDASIEIDLADNANGIYFMEIETSNFKENIRLVKQ